MKYISDVNNFDIINESIDIYDFGEKQGDLNAFFNDASKLKLPIIKSEYFKLSNYRVHKSLNNNIFINYSNSNYYWIIQYYGDFCYGVYRLEINNNTFDADNVVFAKLCDDIGDVILTLDEKMNHSIRESVDVYDFGRKYENLKEYFNECVKMVKSFPDEVVDLVIDELPGFEVDNMFNGDLKFGEYYLYIEMGGYREYCYWLVHYYGDFCYGLFRFNTQHDYQGELEWIEFCDDIDPVIQHILRDKKRINK